MDLVRDKQFYQTIFRIALPSAFQSLISLLVVLVDNMMVSSLGDGVQPLAAVSQTNSLTAFFTATIFGLTSGSAVLIAQYWGKRDTARIKRVFAIVFAICTGVSLLAVLAAKLFPNALLGVVIGSGEAGVLEYALPYFAIVCFSFVPFAMSNSLVGMLRSVEVVKVTLYITVVSLFTNIVGNYFLIFPAHTAVLFGMQIPVPGAGLGVRGAAIATVIARVVEFAIVWYYTFHKQKQLDITPGDLRRFDRLLSRDYLRYGLPVGLADMQWALVGTCKAAIIGHLSGVFMAANNITESMMNLGTLFTFALAGGACVVVGKSVGAGDYDKTRAYSKTIQIMFAGIGVVMAALVYFLRGPFVSLYGTEESAKTLAAEMIAIGALPMIGTSYHAACFVGINRGAGDSRFVMYVDMICGWLIVLPLTFLAAFVFQWPLPIVFLCTRIDQCFKWIIAFIRLRGDKWIRNVTRTDKEAANGSC